VPFFFSNAGQPITDYLLLIRLPPTTLEFDLAQCKINSGTEEILEKKKEREADPPKCKLAQQNTEEVVLVPMERLREMINISFLHWNKFCFKSKKRIL